MKVAIKVWCEYDISGNFGGNSDEEVFYVDSVLDETQIEALVLNVVSRNSGVDDEDEMEDLYGWEFINIEELT